MAYTTYKNGDFGDGANDIAFNHIRFFVDRSWSQSQQLRKGFPMDFYGLWVHRKTQIDILLETQLATSLKGNSPRGNSM